jgi:hypothetical protein
MAVDGGASCRAVRHWRDWDPAGAQPPRAMHWKSSGQ